MKNLTSLEHAAAASAAVVITWASVSAVANLGYPATVAADIAAVRGGGNASAIAAAPRPMAKEPM